QNAVPPGARWPGLYSARAPAAPAGCAGGVPPRTYEVGCSSAIGMSAGEAAAERLLVQHCPGMDGESDGEEFNRYYLPLTNHRAPSLTQFELPVELAGCRTASGASNSMGLL